MKMIETLKKSKGKSKPITINQEIRDKIASFKSYLIDYMLDPSTPKKEKDTLYYLLYEMEPYEQNLLLAYYEWGTEAAKMLNVSTSVLQSNVKRILFKIKTNKYKSKL